MIDENKYRQLISQADGVTDKEIARREKETQKKALEEQEAQLASPESKELLTANTKEMSALLSLSPTSLKKTFNTSPEQLNSFVDECTLDGISVLDGFARLKEQKRETFNTEEISGILRNYGRDTGKGLSLGQQLVGKELRNSETLLKLYFKDAEIDEGEKREVYNWLQEYQKAPKFDRMLNYASFALEEKGFHDRTKRLSADFAYTSKAMEGYEKAIRNASNPAEAQTLEKELQHFNTALHKTEQQFLEEIENQKPARAVTDTVEMWLSELSISGIKGLEFFMPKGKYRELVHSADAWRGEFDEMFGEEYAAVPTGVGASIMFASCFIPAGGAYKLVGTFLNTSKSISNTLKVAAVAGGAMKAYPVGSAMLEGEFAEAGKELAEGVAFETLGAGGMHVIGKALKGSKKLFQVKNLFKAKLTEPVVKAAPEVTKQIKKNVSLNRKALVGMIKEASDAGGNAQLNAKGLWTELCDDAASCPENWYKLGKQLTKASDDMVKLGMTGFDPPKPSAELIYCEGMKAKMDLDIIEDLLTEYGKTVKQLDQAKILQIQSADKVTKKLYNNKYFKEMLAKSHNVTPEDNFLSYLDEMEGKVFQQAHKEKGLSEAVKTVTDHRVNNNLMKLKFLHKKGKVEEFKALHKKTAQRLQELRPLAKETVPQVNQSVRKLNCEVLKMVKK